VYAYRDQQRQRRNALPDQHYQPEDRRVPLDVERHHPIDRREGDRQGVEHKSGGAQILCPLQCAHVAVLVLLLRPPAQVGRQSDPDGEINDAPNEEAILIKPCAFVLDQLELCLVRDPARVHPYVEAVQPDDRDRQKQYEHQPERVRSGFELPANQQPPARAAQVLDHQKSQAAERGAGPEDESDQVRMKECVLGVARNDRADNPDGYAHPPGANRDVLDSSEILRRSVIIGRQLPCPPEAGVGALDFSLAFSNSCLSDSGSSPALAYWLACSARI